MKLFSSQAKISLKRWEFEIEQGVFYLSLSAVHC